MPRPSRRMVRGWLQANGDTGQPIHGVFCADRAFIDGACHGDVCTTVDNATATRTNGIGHAVLRGGGRIRMWIP